MTEVLAPYTASEGNGITSVDFFVSDAAKLESIVQEVQNSTSIDWNSYYITVNNEVYERISSSIADTTTLVTTLIVVITVVSMVLIVLILSMSIRSRKRETGILLAVGIAKPAVILQYVLETLLIAVVAFPLAYLSSKQVAGLWGRCSQGGGECHRHTGAFPAGGYRGRHPAGGGGAGIQYLDHAVESQGDTFPDGIKFVQRTNASKKINALHRSGGRELTAQALGRNEGITMSIMEIKQVGYSYDNKRES